MPTVRTTMRPDQQIEVDDAEYIDLQRQGLLVDDTTAVPPATAAPANPAKKTSGAAGSKEN
jgi:hypothetical protein